MSSEHFVLPEQVWCMAKRMIFSHMDLESQERADGLREGLNLLINAYASKHNLTGAEVLLALEAQYSKARIFMERTIVENTDGPEPVDHESPQQSEGETGAGDLRS